MGWSSLAGSLLGMDSDEQASMQAEISNGIPKERSRFRTRPGFSGAWDRTASQIAAIVKAHPGATFDVPNEIPGPL